MDRNQDRRRRRIALGSGFTNRQSVLLDGSTKFINIDPVQSALASDTEGTISFFTKPVDGTPSSNETILGFGDTNASEFMHFRNLMDGTFQMDFLISGVRQFLLASNAAAYASGVWNHTAITQGASPIAYFNGVAVPQTLSLVVNAAAWFNDASGLDNGRIGALNQNSAGNTNHYNGNVDEIHFFNTELSAAEVVELYNGGVGWDVRGHSRAANLVSGFHIDGDIVNTCTDYVNGNNGTYVNVNQGDLEFDVP